MKPLPARAPRGGRRGCTDRPGCMALRCRAVYRARRMPGGERSATASQHFLHQSCKSLAGPQKPWLNLAIQFLFRFCGSSWTSCARFPILPSSSERLPQRISLRISEAFAIRSLNSARSPAGLSGYRRGHRTCRLHCRTHGDTFARKARAPFAGCPAPVHISLRATVKRRIMGHEGRAGQKRPAVLKQLGPLADIEHRIVNLVPNAHGNPPYPVLQKRK